MVNIGGICEFDWQCRRSKFGNVCEHDHGLCSCNPGYIKTDRKCYPGKKKEFFFLFLWWISFIGKMVAFTYTYFSWKLVIISSVSSYLKVTYLWQKDVYIYLANSA